MKSQIVLIAVWAGGSIWADSAPAVQTTTTTQTLDLPVGGTLRFPKSIGEMTIEGWDLPRVEIVAVKSVKPGYDEKDASKWLGRVRVHAERRGNDIAVDTVYPKRFLLARPFRDGGLSPIQLEYRVRAPRNARLAIEHQSGEVHLELLTGDIRVTDGKGQITLYLLDGPYAIDARSKLGAVDSDFPGRERRKLEWGHSYIEQAPGAAHRIYLRIGFGDITILKMHQPEEPAPIKK
jgi:hypothetical protein